MCLVRIIKPVATTGSSKMLEKSRITIGHLSKQTGVNIETIRYYEKEAIIPHPARSAGGHRMYSETDVKRLFFVRRCRELGFSIREISSLLSLVEDNKYTCATIHDLTLQHAAEIRKKIGDLVKMETVLKDMAAECSQGEIPDCPIVDKLFKVL
jgi:MerR family mercuric resistance operon transcriptional regulator